MHETGEPNILGVPAAAEVRPAANLQALAEQVKQFHAAGASKQQASLQDFVEAGRRLKEAKAALPRKQWLPWLAGSVGISRMTASRYMRLAECNTVLQKPEALAQSWADICGRGTEVEKQPRQKPMRFPRGEEEQDIREKPRGPSERIPTETEAARALEKGGRDGDGEEEEDTGKEVGKASVRSRGYQNSARVERMLSVVEDQCDWLLSMSMWELSQFVEEEEASWDWENVLELRGRLSAVGTRMLALRDRLGSGPQG